MADQQTPRYAPSGQSALFADLAIGDRFDFISGTNWDSFHARCTKVGPRAYAWTDRRVGTLSGRVGSVKVRVYHVERAESAPCAECGHANDHAGPDGCTNGRSGWGSRCSCTAPYRLPHQPAA